MTTDARFHNILDQVDGVKDTFELPEPFIPGSIVLAYNGQIFQKGQHVAGEDNISDPATVTLTFVPATDTHALMIIYKSAIERTCGLGIRGFTHPPGGLLNDY